MAKIHIKKKVHYTEDFLTPDSFHSTSLATWGSSWVSKEAKFIKKFDLKNDETNSESDKFCLTLCEIPKQSPCLHITSF